MKHLDQAEILQLIRDKKVSPNILKPYKEEDEPIKEVSGDDLIVQALCEIRNALQEANRKEPKDNSGLLEGIGEKIEALTKAVKDKPIVKPIQWEHIPEYDNEGRIESITSKPKRET